MTMQRCKTADDQGYGEPQNAMSNGENVIDKTIVCPTCEGRGRLPMVRSSQSEIYQIRKLSRNKTAPYASSEFTISTRRSSSKHIVPRLPTMHLPTLKSTISMTENCPRIRTSITHFLETAGVIEGTNEKIDRRTERLIKCALLKLSSSECEVRKEGLEECSHIAQHYPDEMDLHMNQVYCAMRHLLVNHRPRDTLFVCHVARGFFARLRSTCKPEFENLVLALLVRTADSSFYIRCYVNDALEKMVTYIPSLHVIRPLVGKGCKHKNPLVRTSAIRLLTDIVTFRTSLALLTQPHLREPCKKIIETGAQLLADNNLGTRAAAKNLFLKFVDEEGFERMYEVCNIDEKIKSRIAQTISSLKQIHNES